MHDSWLHHLKERRNVEIAGGIKRRVADLQDFLARSFAVELCYLWQDRIAHRFECLRDQCRADDARRVAGSERNHSTPPALRHWQRKQIAQQVDDVLEIVVKTDALRRVGANASAVFFV